MEKLSLVPITFEDISFLSETEYKKLTIEKRKELIASSQNEVCAGKFFKFFIIKKGRLPVGVISLAEQSNTVISIAPSIINEHRRKGYGVAGGNLAFNIAKEKGYKVVLQTVREDNLASVNLHEKLGFELVKKCVSKNNNEIRIYLKLL